MSPQHRRALLAFCLLGLGASTAAAYVHYRMLMDPTYVSLCDVSATVNCQSLYRSAYGSVRGVPISLIGTLWFLLIGLLAWFDGPASSSPKRAAPASAVPGYLFLLSTAALAMVIYLAYASWVVLQTVCIYCILT